ncbi:MAG: hypothetical protein GX823_04780 [Clostridiales bacterium]|nr:hypothetical protein [Clostridiales bacterium]
MSTFDDLKKVVLDAADVIADVSVDLYKKAEAKTKELARAAKLHTDIASDKTSIKRLYMQIGKTYYETHKMFPAEEFEQNCAEISTLFERIADRKAELEELRSKGVTDDDITDVEDLEDLGDECEEECCCGECEEKED